MIVEELRQNPNIQVWIEHERHASKEQDAHKSSARMMTMMITTTPTMHLHAPTMMMMPFWHCCHCCSMLNGTHITVSNQDFLQHHLPTKAVFLGNVGKTTGCHYQVPIKGVSKGHAKRVTVHMSMAPLREGPTKDGNNSTINSADSSSFARITKNFHLQQELL
jgi:hypothetical protein